jgi:hypothetical protein
MAMELENSGTKRKSDEILPSNEQDSKKRKLDEDDRVVQSDNKVSSSISNSKIDSTVDDEVREILVFDEIVCIEAQNRSIRIAKSYLINFKFFIDYFELYKGTNYSHKIVVNDNKEYVSELIEFVRNKIILRNKKEILTLMHKWNYDQEKVIDIFESFEDLKYIPHVEMNYFRPVINHVLNKFNLTTFDRTIQIHSSIMDRIPSHVKAELFTIYLATSRRLYR